MQWILMQWFNMQRFNMQWIAVALILIPCICFVLWKSARFLSQLRNAAVNSELGESSQRTSSCSGCSGCSSKATANRPDADFGIKLLPIVTLKPPSEAQLSSNPVEKNP